MDDPLSAWYAALPDADPATVASAGAELLTRWSQPHRRYHTPTHLAAVLTICEAYKQLAQDIDAVRLATWYHDAVYDPTRSDNEERSAELAAVVLPKLGVPAQRVAEVVRLVRMTATHDPVPEDRNGCLLNDADLAVLASPPASYAAYAQQIREEYAHVPDAAFHSGRSAILRQLLDGPSLYKVPKLRASWERAARANIARELTALNPDAEPEPARDASDSRDASDAAALRR